jgi:hypothetical protein
MRQLDKIEREKVALALTIGEREGERERLLVEKTEKATEARQGNCPVKSVGKIAVVAQVLFDAEFRGVHFHFLPLPFAGAALAGAGAEGAGAEPEALGSSTAFTAFLPTPIWQSCTLEPNRKEHKDSER